MATPGLDPGRDLDRASPAKLRALAADSRDSHPR